MNENDEELAQLKERVRVLEDSVGRLMDFIRKAYAAQLQRAMNDPTAIDQMAEQMLNRQLGIIPSTA